MLVKILAAGDYFMKPALFAEALRAQQVTSELAELHLSWPLEPFGPIAEVNEASGTEDELLAALNGVEVAVTQMAPFTERVLRAAPALRFIAVARGGPVNVNIPVASSLGIGVSNAPGRNASAVAEYTVGLMLAVMRQIPDVHADLRRGRWRGDDYSYDRVGTELASSTVGLVGYGAVGAAVARLLRAFGSTILVYDPYVDVASLAEVGAKAVGLEELLSCSTVVSLHARLSDETRSMISSKEIAAMPAGSFLVNTARGELLDIDALCDALESGHLAGAAIDVFAPEPPPPGARVLVTPNLILSPHLSGATKQTAQRAAEIVAADVARYLAGERPANLLNDVDLQVLRS